jgi:septal ring factor EnvC (AmiA/AmiB activator)
MNQRLETKKHHKQQLDSIVQQMHALSSTDASAKEQWQQFQELESQYKALKKEHRQIIRELESQGTNAAGKLLDTIYEPDSKYPWNTQEEYLALRRMQPRLEKQYKDYHADYITSLLPTNDEIFDENELAIRQIRLELRQKVPRDSRK